MIAGPNVCQPLTVALVIWPISGTLAGIGAWRDRSASAARAVNSSSVNPVAVRILEMLSVLGQRGRPSGVNRLDGLNAVGSSPASRASPEDDSSLWRASASIAFQIHSWVRIDDVGLIETGLDGSLRFASPVCPMFCGRRLAIYELSPKQNACR